MAAIVLLIALLFGGTALVSTRLLPWFSMASVWAFYALILLLLPLSAIRATRHFAAMAILCVSYLFGATVWMEGFVTTLTFWGVLGAIIGLCFIGIGVVPFGMLAALFHKDWSAFFLLSLLLVLTFGTRMFAHALARSCEEAARAAEFQAYLDASRGDGESLTETATQDHAL